MNILKFRTLGCVLFLCASSTMAQNLEFELGKPTSNTLYSSYVEEILLYEEGNIYQIRSVDNSKAMLTIGPTKRLEKIDADGNLVKSQLIKKKLKNGNEEKLEKLFTFNNEIMLLGSAFDKESKKVTYYFHKIDKNTLLPTDFELKIGEVDAISKNKTGGFVITTSEDEKMLAFIYYGARKKGTDELKYQIHVFDQELNEKWNKGGSLQLNPEKQQGVVTGLMANNGKVYLIAVADFDEDSQKSLLLALDEKEPAKQVKLLGFSYMLGMNETKDDLYLAGLNGNSVNVTSVDLINLEVKYAKEVEINPAFLEIFTDKSFVKRGKGFYNCKLRDIVPRDEGGFVLIGSKGSYRRGATRYTYMGKNGLAMTYCKPSAGTPYQTTTVSKTVGFKTIFLIRFDSDGNVQWTRRVNQKQSSSNNLHLVFSYSLLIKSDRICVIYNDQKDNHPSLNPDLKASTYFGKPSSSVLRLVDIDNNGKLTHQVVLDNKVKKTRPMPTRFKQISENEMITLIDSKLNSIHYFHFGKLKY